MNENTNAGDEQMVNNEVQSEVPRTRGRFAPGCKGGPGGAGGRVSKIRRAMLDAVDGKVLVAMVEKLVAKARAGNVEAARLVLLYTVGRPPELTNEQLEQAKERFGINYSLEIEKLKESGYKVAPAWIKKPKPDSTTAPWAKEG